jgi:hypothetical protein
MPPLNNKRDSVGSMIYSENQKFHNMSCVEQRSFVVSFLKAFFSQLAAEVGKLLP